jgi:hypothetical protein
MNKITQDVCKWQEEAFLVQKREFDKRSNSRTFGAGDIVYVVRPHSGHLAQKFQPKFEGPFSVIIQKSHNNYLLQDCNKANRTRSVHVNLIKPGTFREQLYDETIFTPLTDSEPPRQPAVLLRTLRNLNFNATDKKTYGHFYDDDDATRLRAAPAAAAAAEAAMAAGNGPMIGGGVNIQGQGNLMPALQNPPTPDLQIDTRVESTSDSDNFDDYENALDRTIISDPETPPPRTPRSSPILRRRPSPIASPSSGARPRTRQQTNKDGKSLGKLHDQPFPLERKRYERKKK